MKQLQFTSPSGIIVSTVQLPYTKAYETMVFDSEGKEIFCKRYLVESEAIKGHNYYMKQNSK